MGGGEITDESYIYKFAKYYCNVTARCFGLTLENHGHGYSFGCFISSPHQFTNNSTFSIVAVFLVSVRIKILTVSLIPIHGVQSEHKNKNSRPRTIVERDC